MTVTALLALAQQLGFSHSGAVAMEALRFLPEVRDMCAADRCRSYGRNWACPPHCGSLEAHAARAKACTCGILVQTTGTLEDAFDGPGMAIAQAEHRARFLNLTRQVRLECPDCLPLSAGACDLCPTCTCPAEPCRFPQSAIPSMEASGLWVSQVCEASGLPYGYGELTVTYTACILVP